MNWFGKLRCKLFGKSRREIRLESAQQRIEKALARIQADRRAKQASRPDHEPVGAR